MQPCVLVSAILYILPQLSKLFRLETKLRSLLSFARKGQQIARCTCPSEPKMDSTWNGQENPCVSVAILDEVRRAPSSCTGSSASGSEKDGYQNSRQRVNLLGEQTGSLRSGSCCHVSCLHCMLQNRSVSFLALKVAMPRLEFSKGVRLALNCATWPN